MEKKIINEFKIKITKDGIPKWYISTLYNDGSVERKEIKKDV